MKQMVVTIETHTCETRIYVLFIFEVINLILFLIYYSIKLVKKRK